VRQQSLITMCRKANCIFWFS